MLVRKSCEREDFGAGRGHQVGCFGPPFGQGRSDVVPLGVDRCLVDPREHGAEQRNDHVLGRFGDPGQKVPGEMDPATLMAAPWKHRRIAAVSPAC